MSGVTCVSCMAFTSALASFSKYSIAPEWPCALAIIKAVNPVLDTKSTYRPLVSSSALAVLLSINNFRTAAVPFSAAFINGVTPSASVNRGSAPCSNSNLTASACPPTEAVINTEILSDRTLFGSASFFNNVFNTSTLPSPDANHNAVTPVLAVASTSAPSLINKSNTFVWLCIPASINAVIPSLSLALTSAPALINNLTTSKWPALAAGIMGVKSSQSRTFTSILSLSSFNNFCTNFLSPSDAAPINRAPVDDMASISALDANCSCNGVYGWSDESHGANCIDLVPRGRTRHCCIPEEPSVSTYPVFSSPWIFHDLAPQCVHLANLTSVTPAEALSFGSILSQDFLERHVPSASTSVSSWGRLCIW